MNISKDNDNKKDHAMFVKIREKKRENMRRVKQNVRKTGSHL